MGGARADGPVRVDVRRLAGWLLLLGAVIVALVAAGRGSLALPAPDESFSAWAARRDAVTLLFVALRVCAMAIAWYLLLVSVVTAVAHGVRSLRLIALAELLGTPPVRAAVQSVLGLSLATATLSIAPGSQRQAPVVATATVDAGVTRAPLPPVLADPRRARPPAQPSARPPAQPSARPPAPRPAERPRAPTPVGAWTVQPGQHFWSIAETVLTRHLRRAPAEAETARYWRRLVEHNRHRLADPSNPDLLFEGQVVELPPLGRGAR